MEKTKEKYWYYTEIQYCVCCGVESKTKERRYTKKPKHQHIRTLTIDNVCWQCMVGDY